MGGRVAVAWVILGCQTLAGAADDKVTIEPREKWGTVFGGAKADFHFVVRSAGAFKGRAAWTFFTVTNRRTISRSAGEADVAAGPGRPAVVEVRLRVPEVNAGVVLQAGVKVSVSGDAAAVCEKPVWVYPRDPFADRKEWLKELKITLFDPAKTTGSALAKLEVPFEEMNNPAAVADLKEGVLVVGEGVSFADAELRDLPEAMAKAAARGVKVLCLAPAGGTMAIAGADNANVPAPSSLSFRRRDVITELDKRLDAEAWPPDGKVVAGALALKADGQVVGEVNPNGGWPWVEATYAEAKGKLVVCGFGLFGRHWDEGPTPRFLLARVLESMTRKQNEVHKETDR